MHGISFKWAQKKRVEESPQVQVQMVLACSTRAALPERTNVSVRSWWADLLISTGVVSLCASPCPPCLRAGFIQAFPDGLHPRPCRLQPVFFYVPARLLPCRLRLGLLMCCPLLVNLRLRMMKLCPRIVHLGLCMMLPATGGNLLINLQAGEI